MSLSTNQQDIADCCDYDQNFLIDVLRGLSQAQKSLPCKYFYDERGSQLFDKICQLDEYYPTRTEQQIMLDNAPDMAEQLGSEVMLIEFGSGSSIKTRILLDELDSPVAYVPLDISEEHLLNTAAVLEEKYPQIEILPLVADFTKPFELPLASRPPSHAAVFFPGSTIGNFLPSNVVGMLNVISEILGPDGGMLIGIDLQKDPAIIEAAYNDAQGVTAEFNLNVLHRINQELDGNFDVAQFQHKAVYNAEMGRIEIHIVSQCDQSVTICDRRFHFARQETILTEYSHKYSVDSFVKLAAQAGFSLHKHWSDDQHLFAVLHLVNDAA